MRNWRKILLILGPIWLSGCAGDSPVSCPDFPMPPPGLYAELMRLNGEEMPTLTIWLNQIYVLRQQLEEREKARGLDFN